MAIKKQVPEDLKIMDYSGVAAVDLSSSRYRAVSFTTGLTTGKVTVSLPSGQGVLVAGILLNEPASGELAEIRFEGQAAIQANSTFNSGVELTVAATTGKLEVAAAGDYVVGISLQAAEEADQIVAARLVSPYQKN